MMNTRSLRIAALCSIALLLTGVSVWLLASKAEAARFRTRGLYINSSVAGESTWYELTLGYTTPAVVGSLRMEFCDNPIPSFACIVPAGLDVSSGILSAQSGVAGYNVSHQDQNLIILSRTPGMTGAGLSTYRFDNMTNPSDDDQEFYIRLTSHASTDGSGPTIDFGSVAATTVRGVGIFTQVPPELVFCVGKTVAVDCSSVDDNLVDFGDLEPGAQTYATTSEMAARTNGRYGYNIYVTGTSFTSGVRQVPRLAVPTESFLGVGQFGMNLTTNNSPALGADPVGSATNITLNTDYTQSDYYMFNSGDLLVSSDYVTPAHKYTSTYILNLPEDQPAGHYSTTVTYVCLAGF